MLVKKASCICPALDRAASQIEAPKMEQSKSYTPVTVLTVDIRMEERSMGSLNY